MMIPAYPWKLKEYENYVTIEFPDLGAHTFAKDRKEALEYARKCLETWLWAAMDEEIDIPPPSPARGRPRVTPGSRIAGKLLLYSYLRDKRIGTQELARRMGVPLAKARAVCDPKDATRLPTMEKALRAAMGEAIGDRAVFTMHMVESPMMTDGMTQAVDKCLVQKKLLQPSMRDFIAAHQRFHGRKSLESLSSGNRRKSLRGKSLNTYADSLIAMIRKGPVADYRRTHREWASESKKLTTFLKAVQRFRKQWAESMAILTPDMLDEAVRPWREAGASASAAKAFCRFVGYVCRENDAMVKAFDETEQDLNSSLEFITRCLRAMEEKQAPGQVEKILQKLHQELRMTDSFGSELVAWKDTGYAHG